MDGPILVLMRPDADHPFDLYLEELLLTEGYNSYEAMDLGDGQLPAGALDGRQLLIVSAGAVGALSRD
jgi:hypothetical protein